VRGTTKVKLDLQHYNLYFRSSLPLAMQIKRQWRCLIYVNADSRRPCVEFKMFITFITVIALIALSGLVVYLFVIAPRSSIHDLWIRVGCMSALGQRRTWNRQFPMSALPPGADIGWSLFDVR